MNPVQALTQNAICLALDFSKLGNSKKVDANSVEVDADRYRIGVSKRLINSPEYEAIKSLDGEIKRWLAHRSLPSRFKSGIYLLPVKLIEQTESKLKEFRAQRKMLVVAFGKVYGKAVEEAAFSLRDLFNPADYPDELEVARKFDFRWNYVLIETPGVLKQIPKFFEEQKAKSEMLWQDTVENARTLLRQTLADLVQNMADKLQPSADGKKKKVDANFAANAREALSMLSIRNVTDDEQLEEMLAKAKGLLRGVHSETIKDDASLKEKVGAGFAKLKEELAPMIAIAPSRAITFDDE